MSVKTILVPTDFSDNAQVAFEKAYELALQLGAKLHVLHVQDESTLRTAIKEGLFDTCDTDEEMHTAVTALTKERFAKLLEGVASGPVAIEHLVQRGDQQRLIVAYARDINADLVVIGRYGAGLVKDLLSGVLGSVAESVIRKSPCPVLVVRRDHKNPATSNE